MSGLCEICTFVWTWNVACHKRNSVQNTNLCEQMSKIYINEYGGQILFPTKIYGK